MKIIKMIIHLFKKKKVKHYYQETECVNCRCQVIPFYNKNEH